MAAVAVGGALGLLAGIGVVLFTASVRLARRGGRAMSDHGRVSAGRIRRAANERLVEAEAGLTGAREELERARSAGTLRRSADDSLARWEGAVESSRRSAQSFQTFAGERHDGLVRRLHDEGTLVWIDGVPQVDPAWYPHTSAGAVEQLNGHLGALEEIRTQAQADGIAAPLADPPPVDRATVDEVNSRLDGSRVAEGAVARIVEEGALGRNLLAARRSGRTPRPDRASPLGRGLAELRRDPGPSWLREAARRSAS
ncbi:hypothetical protein [Nocardiopsis coralliicola]